MTTEDRVALWVLGQLDGEDAADVAADVAADPALARLADEYREVLTLLPRSRTPVAVATPPRRIAWGDHLPRIAAALLLVVGSVATTLAVERRGPSGPVTEAVVVAGPAAANVADAALINHTWGVELLLTIDDTVEGEDYTVWFLDRDGNGVAAGGFVGDADLTVVCRMNTTLLREETTGFRITDASGALVLDASLPARTDVTPGGVPGVRT